MGTKSAGRVPSESTKSIRVPSESTELVRVPSKSTESVRVPSWYIRIPIDSWYPYQLCLYVLLVSGSVEDFAMVPSAPYPLNLNMK